MARGFSEQERAIIRSQLVRACQDCWGRFGYAKTGVRELSALAGISPGAFYQFFDSKERLFMETAQALQQDLIAVFQQHLGARPNKQGVKAGLRAVVFAMRTTPWWAALWRDWAGIVRKLPADYEKQEYVADIVRIDQIIGQYQLTATRDTESATRIIDALIAGCTSGDTVRDETDDAVGFIIDAVVDNLFV